jgi:hypothetical protein
VLAVTARFELASDAVHPLLQPALALCELPLALGEAPRGFGELALRMGQVRKRLCAIALALLDRLGVDHVPEWERSNGR